MAILAVERALDLYGAPLYAFHQIVHNRSVITDFERRGVRFVADIADVPEAANVVFSAHGVSPEVRSKAAERHLHVVDATCPLVNKVHVEARRFARQGFTIVLIGHAGHDETVGLLGEAPDNIRLVETPADVHALSVPNPLRVAYVTQTTLSIDDAQLIIDALKRRFPTIVGPPREDICYATQNRQRAFRVLTGEAEVAMVIGSCNSSNSQRLAEVANGRGVPAHLVDGPEDLRPEWFEGISTVALTAGASVPEMLVQATVAALAEKYQARMEEHRTTEESMHFSVPILVRASHLCAGPESHEESRGATGSAPKQRRHRKRQRRR
jgi:4-hydroxy-3-methylbut-2-enyl diphosphate reductase